MSHHKQKGELFPEIVLLPQKGTPNAKKRGNSGFSPYRARVLCYVIDVSLQGATALAIGERFESSGDDATLGKDIYQVSSIVILPPSVISTQEDVAIVEAIAGLKPPVNVVNLAGNVLLCKFHHACSPCCNC